MLSCHTDRALPGWADWSPAITDMECWYSHGQFLPLQRSSFTPPPFSHFWPQPGARPPPTMTPLYPGEDKSWAWCSELTEKSTRLLFTPARSRESPAPDFSGFLQHKQLHAGRGEAETDLCVVVLSPFITLLASSRGTCLDLFLPKTEEGSLLLLLTLSIFMVSACIEWAALLQWTEGSCSLAPSLPS